MINHRRDQENDCLKLEVTDLIILMYSSLFLLDDCDAANKSLASFRTLIIIRVYVPLKVGNSRANSSHYWTSSGDGGKVTAWNVPR